MNCQHIQTHIDDYMDGSLVAEEAEQFDAHVAHCVDCQAIVAKAEALQVGLRSIEVPAMSPGFAERAITQAAGEPTKRSHQNAFVAGFGSALVAGFAILLVVVGLLPGGGPMDEGLTEIAISIEAPQTVNLAIDVAQAMDNATLSIVLPANVEVVGYPGLTELTWQTDLEAGRNVLPLPLKGIALAEGELLASVEQDGKKKLIRFSIKVGQQTEPQASLNSISLS